MLPQQFQKVYFWETSLFRVAGSDNIYAVCWMYSSCSVNMWCVHWWKCSVLVLSNVVNYRCVCGVLCLHSFIHICNSLLSKLGMNLRSFLDCWNIWFDLWWLRLRLRNNLNGLTRLIQLIVGADPDDLGMCLAYTNMSDWRVVCCLHWRSLNMLHLNSFKIECNHHTCPVSNLHHVKSMLEFFYINYLQ